MHVICVLNKSNPQQHHSGVDYGVNYDDSGQLITDLDYADDVVIFALIRPAERCFVNIQ